MTGDRFEFIRPCDYMPTVVETFALAADAPGSTNEPYIWCLNEEAAGWISHPVMRGHHPFEEVTEALIEHSIPVPDLGLYHGTSWRIDGDVQVNTCCALIPVQGMVIADYEKAIAIRVEDAGPEPWHDPADPATPSDRGVLFHMVCHLRQQYDSNVSNRMRLNDLGFAVPLAPFKALPALLYGATA